MGILNTFRRVFRLTSPSDVAALAGRDASFAGYTINPDTALQLSTVFACVRLISETVGTLPCQVYERTEGGGKKLAPNHPLYDLLHDSPNADMTAVEFYDVVCSNLCLWGNHFSEISRNGVGSVVSIYPLDPQLVTVSKMTDGSIQYEYADPNDGYRIIPEENILHVKGFGLDGIVGLSPIAYARQSLGIAMSAEEVAGATYKNGMRPSGVATTDKVLNPDQRTALTNILQSAAGGQGKAGGIMVLEAGLKYQQVTMNPVDAQMLENRAFNVGDICRWFRVPPFMVGYTEKSTSWGTGLEQQNIGFATYTLRPYLSRIEQAIKKKIFTPQERRKYLTAFNLDGLLRADAAGRSTLYSSALQNGWMSRNEVRAKENLGPVDGGDELTVQVNLTPLDQLGKLLKNTGNQNGA